MGPQVVINESWYKADLARGGGCLAQPTHRHTIPASFTQRGRQDFDDPEAKRYRWGFCQGFSFRHRRRYEWIISVNALFLSMEPVRIGNGQGLAT